MNKILLTTAALALGCVHTGRRRPAARRRALRWPLSRRQHRPYYPSGQAGVSRWRAGYWGPRAGIYIGAPAYWGGGPYAWGAA